MHSCVEKELKEVTIREDIKIPHSQMTKACWETLVTCL